MITIVDYGMGNLGSIANIVKKIGGKTLITSTPSEVASAEKLILPGVGAFDRGMSGLQSRSLVSPLNEAVTDRRVPLLGICLGMQLMFQGSEEGTAPGLGWLAGHARYFQFDNASGAKVPNMGWNTVDVVKETPLMPSRTEEQRFYFLHSYHVVCERQEDVMATSKYGGIDITAAVSRDNIFGAQFHPEKSHRFGMALFKRFLEY